MLRGTALHLRAGCYDARPERRRLNRMTDLLPPCPQCASTFTYVDSGKLVCPECAHEWTAGAADAPEDLAVVYKDANGNVLVDGDTVTIIKDLKVKGASSALKAGTKVKGIRLVEGDHNIDCRIEGFGAMKLKSEFVRKA
jgi:protein PhnA